MKRSFAAETRSPSTYAAYVAMCLIWGSTFLVIRIGNEAVPPIWAAVVRLVIATVLYAVIGLAVGARFPRGPALRAAIGYGLLNYGVNFALLYWGELRISSGTAAVLYGTTPLLTSIFAAMMGVHPLQRHEIVGSLIGFAGVALLFSGELSAGGPPAALLAIFGAAVAAALSSVILKQGPPQSTWVVNGVGAAVGAAVCWLVSIALREPHSFPHGVSGWGPILYLVLAGNLGAYALYGWLVMRWKVTSASSIALIIPVVAVILGAIVRDEKPPAGTYAGAALVLAGVATTLFAKRR
jgi:drug/metabolite transporter (DMT)-like permease